MLLLAIVLPLLYWGYHKRRLGYFDEVPTMEYMPLPTKSPDLEFHHIHLVEVISRGRLTAIWKAQWKNELVAVKVFCIHDKQSWKSEYKIYYHLRMDHENILRFIGVEERGNNLQAEFWLITEYHEMGSLYDYLKTHVITWLQLCKIAETMARGLAHLHEAIYAKEPDDYSKPAIAHRNFKSKNVLLKADLSACVADFEVALTFRGDLPCGRANTQVGTPRYMSPEVLEGTIFFRTTAFKQYDMYAYGLVLWELVSRCTAQDGPVGEYKLPYDYVGLNPTVSDMYVTVVTMRERPVIKESWRKHIGLRSICETIEDCWDVDFEARLSALSVIERVRVSRMESFGFDNY